MFNNLINMNDFVVFYEKVSQKGLGEVASRILRNDQGRVKSAWSGMNGDRTHWWDIPAVLKRWNLKITGNEDTEVYDYIKERYFVGNTPLQGISVGCGAGNKEIKWVQTITNLTLTGIDISSERISLATHKARELNIQDRLMFEVRNIYTTPLGQEKYDLIVFDSSLHHFSPIEVVLDNVYKALKPGGLLIVNEYVGPSRFQWTTRQLEIVNDLLNELPESYRLKNGTTRLKNKVYRPGKLSMYVSDPSEAVESDKIEQELMKRFVIIEKMEYGGTILQLLFKDIADNFINDDDKTKNILKHIFTVEDTYLTNGELKSDFTFYVARSKYHDN